MSKPRKRRFRVPEPSDPPKIVKVTWIDAKHDQSETDVESAGGLARLPAVGFHIKTERVGEYGPFVVISQEYDDDDPIGPSVRFSLSIPTAWIVGWEEVSSWNQLFPIKEEPKDAESSEHRDP